MCVPLCVYMYVHMWYICHNFFISSIDGHIGCFHILAIVNNAGMNIEVHLSFWISVFVFFGYSKMELLD